jgi:hypothetical protein
MATARVTVLTLKGGLARQVLVDYERDTVASLKRQVASLLNSTTTDVKLVYRAKPLFDEMMVLARAGIRGDCTVHVVHRVHGGGIMVSFCNPQMRQIVAVLDALSALMHQQVPILCKEYSRQVA